MDLDDDGLPIRVTIPSFSMVDNDYALFQIILENGAVTWKLERRYSEFLCLHKELHSISSSKLPHFPGKHNLLFLSGGTRDSSFLNRRKEKLTVKYLQGILENKNLRKTREVKVFLDLDNLQSARTVKSFRNSMLGGKAFGIDIENFNILLENQESDVPFVVEQCCSYIFLNGIDSPKIFFKNPDASQLARAEKLYNSGEDVDFRYIPQGEYVAAKLLYNFLRDLPHPLLNHDNFSIIYNTSPTDILALVHSLSNICKKMPKISYSSLRDTICTLGLVADNYERTQVSVDMLAQLFTPILLIEPNRRIDPENYQGAERVCTTSTCIYLKKKH